NRAIAQAALDFFEYRIYVTNDLHDI
ncbi:MAG: hypothetical protein K0S39_6327, partial [Paenibacillus sp.]|nr:hypothetical protein [Paenibacillus sp.]